MTEARDNDHKNSGFAFKEVENSEEIISEGDKTAMRSVVEKKELQEKAKNSEKA